MPIHHDAPFSGVLPNIYNQALTFDHLRLLPTFTALPPVDSICIAGPSSYRYVRQDDDLWDRLHAGRLTSGYLSAALGLFEPTAAKRLKLNKNRISHGPLLSAYRHLSQQPYHPSVNEHITEESAALRNAQITLAFNKDNNLNKNSISPNSGGGGGGAGGGDESISAAKIVVEAASVAVEAVSPSNDLEINAFAPKEKNKNRRPNKKKKETATAVATAAALNHNSFNSNFILSEEFKLKKARALSSQGLDAVRCAWGTAQESTTLHVLGTGIFQNSEILEAGLFIMEESVLPKSWNFLPGELPPIGSSPDALAKHPTGQASLLENKRSNVSSSNGSDGHLVEIENKDEVEIETEIEGLLNSKLTLEEDKKHMVAVNQGVEERKSESLEVVEVKNTCPFDYSQHTYGGKKRRKFVVCDRGPRNQIDVLWMPQLQLHMLCTQTASALLVSRSATRGLRVFRVAADVEFQRLMLCVLRKLYTEHVIPQKVPEKDVYEGMPEHGELINRLRRAVHAAEVVKEIDGDEAAATLSALAISSKESLAGDPIRIDSRFFLD